MQGGYATRYGREMRSDGDLGRDMLSRCDHACRRQERDLCATLHMWGPMSRLEPFVASHIACYHACAETTRSERAICHKRLWYMIQRNSETRGSFCVISNMAVSCSKLLAGKHSVL